MATTAPKKPSTTTVKRTTATQTRTSTATQAAPTKRRCPWCDTIVDINTAFCPECGEQLKKGAKSKKKKKHPVLIASLIILGILIIGGMGSSSSSNKKSSSSKSSSKSSGSQPITTSKSGGSDLECDYQDTHLKYLKHEIATNAAGEKCLVVYFDFTNNSSDNKQFWTTYSTTAFQNGVELDTSYFNVNDYTKNYSREIQPGTTITVATDYKIGSDSSTVTVQVTPFILGNVLIDLSLSL